MKNCIKLIFCVHLCVCEYPRGMDPESMESFLHLSMPLRYKDKNKKCFITYVDYTSYISTNN